MAQILPLHTPFFRTAHLVIDEHLAAMGPTGFAVYSVLQRHANYTTGECWPSVKTIAAKVGIGLPRVRKALTHLERLGLIDVPVGAPSSRNRYRVHDATQTAAVAYRQWERNPDSTRERDQNALPIGPEISPQPVAVAGVVATPSLPEQDPKEQEEQKEKKESTQDGFCVLAEEDGEKAEEAAAPEVSAVPADTVPAQDTPPCTGTLRLEAACTTLGHTHRTIFPGTAYCRDCWRHWQVPLEGAPGGGGIQGVTSGRRGSSSGGRFGRVEGRAAVPCRSTEVRSASYSTSDVRPIRQRDPAWHGV